MKKPLLIILFLFALSSTLSAQTIITDRPDQTESSATVPWRSLQIEAGILRGFTDNNITKEKQLFIPTTLFRYGLTRTIELRFAEQLELLKYQASSDNIFGLCDIELGAKIQILKKEDINTEIAVLSHVILPTGSDGLSNDHFGSITKIAVSHSLTDLLGIGYNIGYNYFGQGKGDLTYSFVFGAAVSEKAGVYAETYGELREFKEIISNFDSGITYLIKDNLQLDLSFGIGLNNKMNYISIGCSWNINKKQYI